MPIFHKNILTSLSMATGLGLVAVTAGCNSSGSSSHGLTSVYSDSADENMKSHIAAKGTLETNGKAVIRTNDSVSVKNTAVSTTFDGADGVTVTALGKTAKYKTSDLNQDEFPSYQTDNGWLYTFGGTVKDQANGTASYKYMMPVMGGMAEDGLQDRYYGTVGLKTPKTALKSKANATYKGLFVVDAYSRDDPSDDERVRWNGSATLNADFEKGKVKGNLDGRLYDSETNELISELDASLKEADISGSGFSTTYNIDKVPSEPDVAVNGTLDGTFFGDKGQEVGGTMTVEYKGTTNDGDAVNGVGAGVWAATEDAAPGS